MFRLLSKFLTKPSRRREAVRLEGLRSRHTRWKKSLYGERVQVARRQVNEDPPIGTIGMVLSMQEHGIEVLCGGSVVTLTPRYEGIRGHHFRVALQDGSVRTLSKYILASA